MKKNIYKIQNSLILLLILGLLSCNEVLDQAPDGKITLKEVFEDHFKTGAYLNTCYRKIPQGGLHYWYTTRGPVVVSDEAWDNDDIEYPQGVAGMMYNGEATSALYPMTELIGFTGYGDGKYFERLYEGIKDCCVFIANINEATVNTEAERRRWRAEAHMLRAYYYSELLKWYGTGLPIVREPYEDPINADYTTLEKPTYKEVIDFILEDIAVGMNTEELPWRITSSSETARMTKAVGEALKSRMTLYAASPLYNEGENFWELAYKINKEAYDNLSKNGYELYNKINFPGIYQNDIDNPNNQSHLPNKHAALMNEYFTRDPAYSTNPVDKETIYFHWNSAGASFDIEGIGAQSGKAGTVPTQEMVDAYETIDGETILDLKKPYLDEKHLQPNFNPKNTLYKENDPYVNRDPRFYASIYYNGSKRSCKWSTSESEECKDNWNYSPNGNGPVFRTRIISTWVGEPLTGIHPTSRAATRTGYYIRKFLTPNHGDGYESNEPKPKLFRLGEVMLNLAEAAVETNHLEEATLLINQIRERAGMPKLKSEITSNQEEMRLRVRHERRIELALEGHRFFDIRRWQKPDGNLLATDRWATAMEITRHEKADGSFSHYTYKRRNVRAQERSCYDNKYLKAPIPQAEANKFYTLTGMSWQNPGW
ncbi:RagB/SusD family nutrient uptake outer membrane protein [Dysgonomonas sp. Marseille-P4361]|uniref:RagB/SusD family nutrient uptake outer membrane protein n=1 Tax=Dysgonomonas sp. Marseille-P4361 TaxID=2161820 RepID=UPI000D561327|nr:RagB/SusD family nutrient uptake outer membrane protein [Dysgonomonas sp. Marseille-P4361]